MPNENEDPALIALKKLAEAEWERNEAYACGLRWVIDQVEQFGKYWPGWQKVEALLMGDETWQKEQFMADHELTTMTSREYVRGRKEAEEALIRFKRVENEGGTESDNGRAG